MIGSHCVVWVPVLSTCLSVYLYIFLFIYLSICLSLYIFVYLSIYSSICLSLCIFVYLSINLSIYLTDKQTDRQSGTLSKCMFGWCSCQSWARRDSHRSSRFIKHSKTFEHSRYFQVISNEPLNHYCTISFPNGAETSNKPLCCTQLYW